jgi:hypothetical protein
VCESGDRLCGCQGLSASERERQVIPRATLLAVLRREDELRMCMPVQALYDRYRLPPPEIEAELQRVALAEHGLCRCWLPSYWQTAKRYPAESDVEVRGATVWLRVFERTRKPEVSVGERVPAVSLLDLDSGQPVNLVDGSTPDESGNVGAVKHRQRPLVAIAGSGS